MWALSDRCRCVNSSSACLELAPRGVVPSLKGRVAHYISPDTPVFTHYLRCIDKAQSLAKTHET